MTIKKHAYLIIAHNNFEQLIFLIQLLDHDRNDIYLFVDKKVDDREYKKLEMSLSRLQLRSKLEFTERVIVNWGDFSQIVSEMILFKSAFAQGDYAYYHLISGSDLPLVSQERMHEFFDRNQGKQFLTMVSHNSFLKNKVYERVRFHYLWPHISERSFKSKFLGKFYQKIFRPVEKSLYKLFRVNHFSQHQVKLGYASNWVSIDEKLVSLLLREEIWIRDVFAKSLLCDELFIPTIIYKHRLEDSIYYSEGMENKPESFQGNLRYINWWDGAPYTWTDSDKDINELLAAKANGHFFSRKFDLVKSPQLRDFILEQTQ